MKDYASDPVVCTPRNEVSKLNALVETSEFLYASSEWESYTRSMIKDRYYLLQAIDPLV